mgnify:CR=1 FL=1
MGLHGIELFTKIINTTIYKCKICAYPLSNFKGTKKKEGYCMACEQKLISNSFNINQSLYIKELQKTTAKLGSTKLDDSIDNIDTIDTIDHDEFANTTYYSEVSKFKTFKPERSSSTKIKGSENKHDNKPIINLNMTLPDIATLIKDD